MQNDQLITWQVLGSNSNTGLHNLRIVIFCKLLQPAAEVVDPSKLICGCWRLGSPNHKEQRIQND